MPQCFSRAVVGRLFLLCGAFALLAGFAVAKRVAPKPVPPVIANGVRYSVDRAGRDQYVVAQDVATDRVLWKVRVFHTWIDPFKEEDNQWVFINELKLMGNTLLMKDEKSRCYSIGLATHSVKKQECGGSAP
jgi:hypothetical protein